MVTNILKKPKKNMKLFAPFCDVKTGSGSLPLLVRLWPEYFATQSATFWASKVAQKVKELAASA